MSYIGGEVALSLSERVAQINALPSAAAIHDFLKVESIRVERRAGPCGCPIATYLKRSDPNAFVSTTSAFVMPYVGCPNVYSPAMPLSRAAQEFIDEFDLSGKYSDLIAE